MITLIFFIINYYLMIKLYFYNKLLTIMEYINYYVKKKKKYIYKYFINMLIITDFQSI